MNLDAFFRPRGVVVVGSTSEGKLARVLIDQLVQGGFPSVFAVNPRGEGAPGVAAAARSIQDLVAARHDVDLAVLASPADTAAGALDDAGRAGIRAAVIIASGFSECGDVAREAELVHIARSHGLRFVGPNCAGLVNAKWNLFPTLETRPPAGDVALISQSGAIGGAALSWAEEQGVGFSKFVSYGNGADLVDVDFLDYLREDGETKVVALYVESVHDGRAFLAAAQRLAAVKPLIVIKAGRSQAGRRAALSHTGSLAGSDAVYHAALRQCGAMRVDGIEEMFDVCRGLAMLPPVRGKRVVIVTNSGGPGVLTADRAEKVGLHVAAPSEALRARLAERLAPFCALGNPIDLTVQGGEAEYRDVLTMTLEEYDAAVAIDVNTPYLDPAPVARGIVAAARAAGKPIAATFLAGQTAAAALPVLVDGRVPDFATGERAVAVLALLARDQARRADAAAAATASGDAPSLAGERQSRSPGTTAVGALPGAGRVLAEPDAMDWLDGEGFPVPQREVVRTAEEAARAAKTLGFPVAVKVVASGVVHKTDAGGVVLDVRTQAAAREAFRTLAERARELGFQGALVVPMVRDAVEILVGLSRDPQFGPVVAVGLGGVTAEALRDVALRVAPIDAREARSMLDELQGRALLETFRGRPPRDVKALADLVARVSRLGFRYPDLGELDLNPVFCLEGGVLIGDARVVRVH